MAETLLQMVARHEGFRAHIYQDGEGHPTIGYGQRLDGAGITEVQALALLQAKLNELSHELSFQAWYRALNGPRQCAIDDMAYTLGVEGVLEFKDMTAALTVEQWVVAAEAIRASKWYAQAPARAGEVAEIIETGRLVS
jgi:lysozyme